MNNKITVNTPAFKEFPPLVWEFGTYVDSKSVSLQGKRIQVDAAGEKHCDNYITASVNLDGISVPPSKEYRMFPYISIKEYSENAGVTELLQHNKIIEKEPVCISSSGFVKISTYRIHSDMMDMLKSIE